MTDQNDNRDMDIEVEADFLSESEEGTGEDTPDFTLEEFESDIFASARLMQDTEDGPDADRDAEPFDAIPEAFDRDDRATETPMRRDAPERPARPEQDRKLLAILSQVFGDRRSTMAARRLKTDYRRALEADGGARDPAAVLRWAVLRLARKSGRLDKTEAEALFQRIAQLLPAHDGGETYGVTTTQTELRAACAALRDAARHLLRVERQLAERTGGGG